MTGLSELKIASEIFSNWICLFVYGLQYTSEEHITILNHVTVYGQQSDASGMCMCVYIHYIYIYVCTNGYIHIDTYILWPKKVSNC
jgi:hypothetical protein